MEECALPPYEKRAHCPDCIYRYVFDEVVGKHVFKRNCDKCGGKGWRAIVDIPLPPLDADDEDELSW